MGRTHGGARCARRRRLTSSCSRTAGRRWARRSPTRTGRSTPTTTCPAGRRAARSRWLDPRDRPRRSRRRDRVGGWRAWVPCAPVFPIELDHARTERTCPICRRSAMPDATSLAHVLVDVFGALDRLYERPLPYMMWLNQRPTDGERLRRRVVQHRDRLAVAGRRRAALHRRRRGGEQRVLQPRHPGGPRRTDAHGARSLSAFSAAGLLTRRTWSRLPVMAGRRRSCPDRHRHDPRRHGPRRHGLVDTSSSTRRRHPVDTAPRRHRSLR